MVELTYFQLAVFLVVFLIIGIGITWRFERTRYEHLVDILRTENDKLKDALWDEMLKNEKLSQENNNEKLQNYLLKKELNGKK